MVNGTGFVSGSVVQWNGKDRPTTFVSASQLQAAISESDISAPGAAEVAVYNPTGQISNALAFTVTAAPCVGSAEPLLNIPLQPGFYIAEVRNAAGTPPGYWGMEVLTLTGKLDGGFNLGGGVQGNGTAPAFGAFYISEPQTVRIDLKAQAVPGGDAPQLSVAVRLLDSSRRPLGDERSGSGSVVFEQTLLAGFYIIEVRTGAKSPRANFQLGLNAPFFSAGINVGGFVSAGQVGFGAFYVPEPQSAKISVLGPSAYGSGAATCLRLTLLDSSRTVIRTVP
jgi:hypothetical protein